MSCTFQLLTHLILLIAETLQKPPRNAADLKSELAALKAHRLTNKERREQGLPPLPTPSRETSNNSTAVTSSIVLPLKASTSPSLRNGGSIGVLSMEDSRPASISKRTTWREAWQEATERHVV